MKSALLSHDLWHSPSWSHLATVFWRVVKGMLKWWEISFKGMPLSCNPHTLPLVYSLRCLEGIGFFALLRRIGDIISLNKKREDIIRNQLSGNDFCRGLVAWECGEAMGFHADAGRSVNFVYVQYHKILNWLGVCHSFLVITSSTCFGIIW